MKGKSVFSRQEADEIINLIRQKVASDNETLYSREMEESVVLFESLQKVLNKI